MNSNEHSIFGGIATFLANCLIQKKEHGQIDLGRAIGCGLLGSFVSLLPDIFEPATNPNHRKFFHSISSGASLIILINYIKNNWNISEQAKEFWISMILAYESHLATDLTTPKSLPLI